MLNKPENTEESAETLKAGKSQKTVVREYAEALIIALILALIIRTFIIQAFKIPTGSMEPTLLVGDHLLVSKFSDRLYLDWWYWLH